MIKNIIFDCDGVLVNSEILSNAVDAEEFSNVGYKIKTEGCIKKFTGLSSDSVKEIIKHESGIELTDEFMHTLKEKIKLKLSMELEPLVPKTLEYISNHKIPNCIASSSKRDRVITSLKVTNIIGYFDEKYIFTSQMVQKGKPEPDLFIHSAKHMCFDPEQTIVIEDSVAGIRAGIAAGMQAVAFLGGCHTRFDWYKDRVAGFNIPMLMDDEELVNYLQKAITI